VHSFYYHPLPEELKDFAERVPKEYERLELQE
jgi:hypothetical protein